MKRLTSILALALTFTLAQGATPDDLTFSQHLDNSHRSWESGPLSLDEFKGHPSDDTIAINLDWHYAARSTNQRIGRDKYSYYEFIPYLDMTESWIKPTLRNEHTLRLAQTTFDLLRLYGVKATAEYARRPDMDSRDLFRFVSNQYRHRFDDMVYDTQKGQDTARVQFYASAVALELEQEHFDPSRLPMGEPALVSDLYVGLGTFMPCSDYFSGISFGLAFGLGFGYGRHLGLVDMGLHGGNTCEIDIPTRNGWIEQGDDVSAGFMRLTYGCNVTPQSRNALYPAVGLGVTFFDGPQLEADDPKHRSNEVSGFALHAGVIYDINLRRHFSIAGGRSCLSQSIRVMPTIDFSDLAHGIGWTPSFNLSVVYLWRGTMYK